MPTSVKDWQF